MEMGEAKIIYSPDTKRSNRVPPGQAVQDKIPTLSIKGAPAINPAKWQFSIFGAVEQKRLFSFPEFMALPRVRVFADIHCVTGWTKLDNTWEGVSAAGLKDLVKIKPEARFITAHCADGYTGNLAFEDFFQEDVVLATRLNGKDLDPGHGFPMRLVVPRRYFYKSPKWVTAIEFMEKDRLGFWEARGYHNHANPWKEERYSGR
jgi:DMSO/TMAO reductase YedYZ molybdopterin-dependent catalytic subunit